MTRFKLFTTVVFAIAALDALPLHAQNQPPLPEGTHVLRDLPYVTGGHERQKLELYLPPGKTNAPVIVFVHGGAWREGNKDRPATLAFVAKGYAVASVNYRLSQQAIFPAQIQDCKAAVRWLRAHTREYGIDPTRFGASGPSAGGHLVALLGTTGGVKEFEVGEHLDQSSQVQCVVDFFGPTDFLQMDAHRPLNGMVHEMANSPESQLVGGHIRDHPDRAARANPVTYVTGGSAPFLIAHGDADPLVPHHQSELLEAALKKVAVAVQLYTVKGGGHGGFKDPALDKLVEDFLAKHLLRR